MPDPTARAAASSPSEPPAERLLLRPRSDDTGPYFPGSDLTADEVEFARAMCEYQVRHRRRYPAWSEVLLVLRSLGYAKNAESGEPAAESRSAP